MILKIQGQILKVDSWEKNRGKKNSTMDKLDTTDNVGKNIVQYEITVKVSKEHFSQF